MTELSARQREAALRRAIIRVQPKYYSWSPEAQERYRVTMPEQDRFRIKQALLQALFGIRVNTEESMEAAIDDFDDARQMRLNETMLLILGVGADSFYLNEYTDDKTILDFPTLYDYDHDDHCFQEQARKGRKSRVCCETLPGTPLLPVGAPADRWRLPLCLPVHGGGL